MVGDPRGAVSPPAYRPQLATLVKAPPQGSEWLHEIKYDGYRIGAEIRGRKVRLLSRSGLDWTARFPAICEALASLGVKSALLDGEIAAELADGRTSFQALQNVQETNSDRVAFFVFDVLFADGRDLGRLPLEERKTRLASLLGPPRRSGPVRYAEHVDAAGGDVLGRACELGLEGIISKRRDRPYRPGRNDDWRKSKCLNRQEFVIGGFTDPEGRRQGLGALLIGTHHENGELVYAGKVGTGFSDRTARELRERLDELEQPASPFARRPPLRGRRVHWVRPTLVAEIAFTEWTTDGKARHPSFQGLRGDKNATDVHRERPRPQASAKAADSNADSTTVAGVRISHPTRVVFGTIEATKLDLARYYEAVAEWVLPHLRGRPLTLVRCPDGAGGPCFFMKHSRAWGPGALRRVSIREKTKVGEYLIADDLPALVGLVQMNVLEIHTWNSTDTRVEEPDRLVLDIDPGPRVPWKQTVEAARLARRALEAIGLRSFVKTTGGSGLHVVAPLVPEAGWNACLAVAKAVAEAMVRHDPARYTTTFAKAGREDKLLIDYLRNNRTNTSVAAFSTRAQPAGEVSMPLAWEELTARTSPDRYTIRTVPKRLTRRADPWAEYWTHTQRLASVKPHALDNW